MAGMEVYFFYYFIPHIGQKYLNRPKKVFYIQKLVVSQVITLNKIIII